MSSGEEDRIEERGERRLDGRELQSSQYFRFRCSGCRIRLHLQRRYDKLEGRCGVTIKVVSLSKLHLSRPDVAVMKLTRFRGCAGTRDAELKTQKFQEACARLISSHWHQDCRFKGSPISIWFASTLTQFLAPAIFPPNVPSTRSYVRPPIRPPSLLSLPLSAASSKFLSPTFVTLKRHC